MKHIYKLNGLDCAACALKLENEIKKIEGINSCNINFIMEKLTIEFSDLSTLEKVKSTCASFEDGVTLKRIG